MSPAPVMPLTTVQKMIGPTTIWIRRMKASPSGCMVMPMFGQKWPIAIPAPMPKNTWNDKSW